MLLGSPNWLWWRRWKYEAGERLIVSDSKGGSAGGIGFCGALFLLFLGLRLTDNIDWEWYWVAAPLWMPLAFVVTVFLPFLGGAAVYDWLARRRRRKAKAAKVVLL